MKALSILALAMIPAETVEQIHQTAVIEEVIGDYVELRSRVVAIGLSPFTNEKTHSFYVVPSKGILNALVWKGWKFADFLDGIREGELP